MTVNLWVYRMSHKSEALLFETVFVEYAPFVWRVLRRMRVADSDLEDICQEVFVVIHRKLPEFESRSHIRSWIFAICRRVAQAHWNRAYHRREFLSDSPPEIAISAQQCTALEKQRLIDRLDAILSRLTEAKRLVYILYEIEEIPMAEIAEMVGCPLHTAFSRLYAARREVEAALVKKTLQRKVV